MNDVTNDYRRVFGSDEGRRVLRHMMQSCHLFASTFDIDARRSAFLEGQRSIVLGILDLAKPQGMTPDEWNEADAMGTKDYMSQGASHVSEG